MISQEGVQTRLARNFTKSFNQTWETDVKIQKASVKWNGNVELQQLIIRDHQQDTLFFVDRVETSLRSFQKALEGNLRFSDVSLRGGKLQLIHYPQDSLHSLDIFLRKFKKDKRQKRAVDLVVSKLSAKDFSIRLIDLKGDRSTQSVDQLQFDLKDIQLSEGVFTTDIQSLNLRYREKRLQLNAYLKYAQNSAALTQLSLQYKELALAGNIELNQLLRKDPELQFNFKGEIEHLEQWLPDLPPTLLGQQHQVELSGQGTLKLLQLNRIQWLSDSHFLEGTAELHQWSTPAAKAHLELDSLAFEKAYLNKWYAAYGLSQFPKWLNRATWAKAKIDYSQQKLDLVVDVYASGNTLHTQGELILDDKKRIQRLVTNSQANFNLKGLNEKLPKVVRSQIHVEGKNISDQAQFIFDATFDALGLLNIKQLKGQLKGTYDNDRLSIQWKNFNENSSNELIANLHLKDAQHDQSIDLLFLGLDPKAYGLELGSRATGLNGYLQARWKGFQWDELEGNILMDQFSIKSGDTVAVFKPVVLQLQKQGDLTQLQVESEDVLRAKVEGEFQLSQSKKLLYRTAHQAFPFIFPSVGSPQGEMTFNVQLDQKILKALYPDVDALKDFSFNGIISDDNQQSRVRILAPYFSMGDFRAYNFDFRIESKNVLYNAYIHADSVNTKKFKLNSFDIISKQIKDTVYYKGNFASAGAFESRWDINAYQAKDSLNRNIFGLKKSELTYLEQTWTLNPKNRPNQLLFISPEGSEYQLNPIDIQYGKEKMKLSGRYNNPTDFDVSVRLDSVALGSLIDFPELLDCTGTLSAEATMVRTDEKQEVTAAVNVSDVLVNQEALGVFDFEFKGNLLTEIYQFQLQNKRQNQLRMGFKGNGIGWKKPAIDATVTLNHFPADFISPLGKNKITDIQADISGEVSIWGPVNDLNQLGKLRFNRTSLSLPYTNVEYAFAENATVDVIDQQFLIRGVEMTNPKSNTSGLLKGTITHENYYKWFLDLSLGTDNLLIIDRENAPEALFYGPGYFKGDARLNGYTKTLSLQLKGETEKGTSIVIPYEDDYTVADVSFIDFVDKNRLEEVVVTEDVLLEKLRGVEMQFDLDINQNAEIEIVMDPASGSSLKGRGAGNLLMEVNTNGKFNMWGDYIATEGLYNFQNLGLIDKKFTLQPGGTIVWEGDPLEAQMNLEAIYEVPGGANPAVLLDNPNFSQKIPTQVGIQLQGNLLKPDDPNFTIEFPNTNQTVSSEINYRLADDQRRQLQAISLLSQGIFINDVSVSVQGLTNNLYEKASDIFSNIVGQENEKLKVGLNYLQGDETLTQQLYAEDRLGLTLSTQISDKILVNGRIGVPVGGVEQTLLVGDVQIDFILSDDGSLRAKVFNKENEFRYISDRLGYTQGIGLNYQVDFETFQDLIRKIVQKQDKP